MKKKLLILLSFSILAIICLTGFIVFNFDNISQTNPEEMNISSTETTIEKSTEINENKTIPSTVSKNEITQIATDEQNAKNIEESKIENAGSISTEELSNIRKISVNGSDYTAQFQNTEKSRLYSNKEREVKIYQTTDASVKLTVDSESGDLLSARFKASNNPETENKITQEKARSIAEKFISTQCDLSEYTPERSAASETFGYEFHYSKFIDGYRSSQSIVILITFDGQLSLYNHSKYEFEGIDTNVKIDGEKLENQLREKLINMYGESVEYVIDSQFVGVNSDNKLVMFYIVDILNDGKSRYIEFDMPIN